MQLKTKIITVP